MGKGSGSVIGGSLWMLFISVLLFWVPPFGAFIAGVVGGMKSGGVGKAIIAVFLPAIVAVAASLALLPFLQGAGLAAWPVIGGLLAVIIASAGIFIALQVGALLLGAIIGGIFA